MTPSNDSPSTNGGPVQGNPITRKVFDLATFDDVNLSKPFTLPTKFTSVQDALQAFDNNTDKLLSIIYAGMTADKRDSEYKDISGFYVVGEDGKPTDTPYTGKFAEDEQAKLIGSAVLTFAKLQSGGKWDSLKKEQKDALKASAITFMRSNPALLASLAPAPAPAE